MPTTSTRSTRSCRSHNTPTSELVVHSLEMTSRRPSGGVYDEGFQRTTSKPAIFFKILTDKDIEEREKARRLRRETILREIVTQEAEWMSAQWRRLRSKRIELKERQMREVILDELHEMWMSGQCLRHPNHVDPEIRGEVNDISEESILRRRLFRGCHREFVNRIEGLRVRRATGIAGRRRRSEGVEITSNFREEYNRHNVLNTITWTAEEIQIYYECMIKHNVWPFRYPQIEQDQSKYPANEYTRWIQTMETQLGTSNKASFSQRDMFVTQEEQMRTSNFPSLPDLSTISQGPSGNLSESEVSRTKVDSKSFVHDHFNENVIDSDRMCHVINTDNEDVDIYYDL